MSYKSIVELLAQAAATLPNNTTQEISPADVRQMIVDFLDSVAPGYSAMTLVTQTLSGLSAAPVAIAPFAANAALTPGVYTQNLVAGSTTRLNATAGHAGGTDFVVASGSVSGPNNSVVTITLFRDGVATNYRTTVTCNGTGDNFAWNIAGFQYKSGADAVYTLRAQATNNGAHVFSNVSFVCQTQVVRDFI